MISYTTSQRWAFAFFLGTLSLFALFFLVRYHCSRFSQWTAALCAVSLFKVPAFTRYCAIHTFTYLSRSPVIPPASGQTIHPLLEVDQGGVLKKLLINKTK